MRLRLGEGEGERTQRWSPKIPNGGDEGIEHDLEGRIFFLVLDLQDFFSTNAHSFKDLSSAFFNSTKLRSFYFCSLGILN